MIDLEALSDAIEAQGRVVRIVLAEVRGSAPRAAGTEMLVWAGGTRGTIGGGRLEWEAEAAAREMLAQHNPAPVLRKLALGPALNQCCGGAVTAILEWYDAARYRAISCPFQGIHVRRVSGDNADMPGPLRRKCEATQHSDVPLAITLSGGWLAESVWRNRQPVVIYGAGHVGRALAAMLNALPQFDVLVSDVRAAELAQLPDTIRQTDRLPTEVLAEAADDAIHLIMTPEHDFDLELCHRLLGRGFAFAGLIGSATKWARFQKRLASLGHSGDQIARITCPIGAPDLGKHPQAIAVGVCAQLLRHAGSERGPKGDDST